MTQERMIDYRLVRQCAPTLAARKVGNLFCMDAGCLAHEPLCTVLTRWNHQLNPSGVYVRAVADRGGRCFIYVFRRNLLESLFQDKEIQHFLGSYGYTKFDVESVLNLLTRRINGNPCFPHEVGLFLGYPLEDVKGFIVNGGQNCKCIGYWKVYGDVGESERAFAVYRKCTRIFNRLFEKGYSLPMLAVAC